ncbi:MAG: alpha/beta fold hydrolase [Candidatus Thorarchaeota archaeon]|nr:alpha/beta fold hydrolase [Candidatus Thorarchaeota archaeon]
MVSFRTYRPTGDTYGQPLPAVLTIHGISSSGAMMDSFNIELARRNFTVVSVDIAGHGRSSERFGFDTFFEAVMDAYEAVRYVQLNDPNTDDTVYGVLGHSLGAGITLLFSNVSVTPESTIIIGGGMGDQFGGLVLPINQSTPRNLMIASGTFDELVTPALALETLQTATGMSTPSPGVIYGNFTEGTARKLVFSNTNHLFEMSDAVIISESIDWLGRALQGEAQTEQSMLDPTQHIYQFVSLLDVIASISFVLSIFPIILITNSHLPSHLTPQKMYEVPAALESRPSLRYSLIIGTATSILLLVLMLMGFIFEFSGLSLIPVSFGTALSLISIVTGVTVVRLSRRILGRELVGKLTIEFTSGRQHYLRNLYRSFILILPVLIWIFGFSIVTRNLLDNPLIITFAADSGAAIFRFIYMIPLTFLLLPLFYSDTIWLNATVGITTEWSSLQDIATRGIKAIVSRLLGYMLLVIFLYVPFLAGAQLGFVMFIALLMLPFAVLFGLATLISVWVGGITRSTLTPALLNAMIFAIVIVSIFQLV